MRFREKFRESAKVVTSGLNEHMVFHWLGTGRWIALFVAGSFAEKTMLRIQRSANGKVVFTLSGRIEPEHVEELRRVFSLETVDRLLVLDLKDVTLVDRDAVNYLARCEANGVELENCPAYIREWIERERSRNGRRNP
jgi:hypothetical protein